MDDRIGRYLGFAFAGADLLVELEPGGRIVFALGAAQMMLGRSDSALKDLAWSDIVEPDDHALVQALLRDLGLAERRGPARVRLRDLGGAGPRRGVSLSLCRLPQAAPNISCVFGFISPALVAEPPRADAEGNQTPAQFASYCAEVVEASRAAGRPALVSLIELKGLFEGAERLPEREQDEVASNVSAFLRGQSLGGQAAGQIAPERFAIVSEQSTDLTQLGSRMTTLLGQSGVAVQPTTAALDMKGLGGQAGVQALQHALERFAAEGAENAAADFSRTLERTLSDGERFRAVVKGGAFELQFQPVVKMASGALHHFEALARFGGGEQAQDIIRLAEDLDLIEAFDLSVVGRVADTLRNGPGKGSIAANVSGRSLVRPHFIDAVMDRTGGRAVANRMLIEITETSAIGDLAAANVQIQRLRREGHIVCLDDFGAGASSLDYLRCLEVDIVKIDGRFIRGLTPGGRDERVLSHMVALCRELAVQSVAEMVETPETAKIVRQLGIDMGQGWYFCKPLPSPEWTPPAPPVRRAGASESWG